jgi:hypothetical protein
VDIRFFSPALRHLDEASAEVAVGSLWQDERPMRGFAGLLDWRLCGRLSALLASGFVRGEAGEVLLVPGKPHVPFEKILLVGLGPRASFDEEVFRRGVQRMASALEGLRVRRAVVELPGRGIGAIDAGARRLVARRGARGPEAHRAARAHQPARGEHLRRLIYTGRHARP